MKNENIEWCFTNVQINAYLYKYAFFANQNIKRALFSIEAYDPVL